MDDLTAPPPANRSEQEEGSPAPVCSKHVVVIGVGVLHDQVRCRQLTGHGTAGSALYVATYCF